MKTSEKFMYALGAIIVIGFFSIIVIMLKFPVPDNNSDELNIALGALIGAFTGVTGYFYGSSAGSKQKTEMLNQKEEMK
jgi:hypothetical protein